ncbi:FYVE zinc finger-domain-containing protein [Lentinula lateritia]|nr:FYVE zinc finger-domain-containing protein [Lentinula lateritia]
MSTGSIPTSTWSSGMNGMMNVNGTNGMYSLTTEQPPNSNNSNIVVKVETVEESFTDTMPPRTHTTLGMDELESKKDGASVTILSPEQPLAVVSASSPGLPNSPPKFSNSLPSSSSLPTPSSSLSTPTSTPMPASLPSSSSSSYASASTSTSPARAPPTLTHTSTFRRVRPSHTSSPLARPNSVILPIISNATDSTSASSVPTNPISPPPSSNLGPPPLTSSVSGVASPSRTLTPPPPPAPTVIVTSPSHESRITSITSPTHIFTSPSLPPTSKSPSKAPYRPGFQPTGLTRFRTDEFLIARKLAREGPGGPGEGIGTNEKRIERTKLERRLEKIIALHFPETADSGKVRVKKEEKGTRGGQEKEREKDSVDLKSLSGNRMPARPVRPSLLGNANPSTDSRRRTSSFFENFDIRDIRRMSGSFIGGIGGSEVESIRSSEQRITPWQPDSAVSRCPHCDTSFHPLSNRKHHCRLCGRVVCALSVSSGKRVEPCSILFVVDPKTRQIEQVEEGVDYGVRKRKPSVDIRSTSSKDGGKPGLIEAGLTKHFEEEQLEEEEKFLKGVRICKECKPVLLREQYLRERNTTTGGVTGEFLRLYEAFLGSEKEIEDSLPAFEELLVGLKMSSGDNNGPNPPHALTAQTATAAAERKRLLQVFARYDALAKRIRNLPCGIQGKGSKGSQSDKGIKAKGTKGEYNINTSQERVQAAIALRAARFLEARMVGLGAVPSSVSAAQGKREKSNSKDSNMGTSPSIGIHPSSSSAIISSSSSFSPSSSASQNLDATLQKTLQPLLEQESLLESYIAEATKARKFEDAKILRGNLREIRVEIGRVVGDV